MCGCSPSIPCVAPCRTYQLWAAFPNATHSPAEPADASFTVISLNIKYDAAFMSEQPLGAGLQQLPTIALVAGTNQTVKLFATITNTGGATLTSLQATLQLPPQLAAVITAAAAISPMNELTVGAIASVALHLTAAAEVMYLIDGNLLLIIR
jgi:hypothetical protein